MATKLKPVAFKVDHDNYTDDYLRGNQKQSLQRVEFDEAILFFSYEKNDAEDHSQTTKKVRDVAEHRPDIGIQSETGLASGSSGRRAARVVWRRHSGYP